MTGVQTCALPISCVGWSCVLEAPLTHNRANLFTGGVYLGPRNPPVRPRWGKPSKGSEGFRVLPGFCVESAGGDPTPRRGWGMCGCARTAAFTRRFHHAPGPAARAASAAAPSGPPRAAVSCPLCARRCLEPPAPLCCCRRRPGSRPGLLFCPAGPSASQPAPRPRSPLPPPGAAWMARGLRRCWHLSG